MNTKRCVILALGAHVDKYIGGAFMSIKSNLTHLYKSKAEEGTDAALKYFGDAFANFQFRNSAQELKRLMSAVMKDAGVELADGSEESSETVENFYKPYLLEKMLKKNSGNEERNRIRANIRNWFNDKNRIMKRESALKILLALEIDDIDVANNFILRTCGDDAYTLYSSRGYEDIIYAFCLKNKLGIDGVEKLIEKYDYKLTQSANEYLLLLLRKILLRLVNDSLKVDEIIDEINWRSFYENEYKSGKSVIENFCKENKIEQDKQKQAVNEYMDSLEGRKETHLLQFDFNDIENESELDYYLNANKNYFGTIRRTAYKRFIEYYEELLCLNHKGFMDSDKLTVEDIYKTVISIGDEANYIPSGSEIRTRMRARTLSVIQRILAESAAMDDTTLKDIKNKQIQVPRKYLISIFLHTWGYIDDVKDPIEALNDLLEECGMPTLDSRNLFDFLIMNSMYWESKQKDFFAIDRVKEIIRSAFNIEVGDV